jgi:hypothetical protein
MRIGAARDQLILDLDTARARVMEAITGLTEEQMSRQEMDGWSVKDHLNHLTACDEIRFFEIGRISRGGQPTFRGLDGAPSDTFNETIVSHRRGLPTEQVLADLASTRSLVVEAIAGAPEHALSRDAYGDYPVDGSIGHDIAHAEIIESWRKEVGI